MKNITLLLILTLSTLTFGQKASRLDSLVSDLNLIASVAIYQQQFEVKKNGLATITNKDNKEFQFHFNDLSFTYNFFGGLYNILFFYKEKSYCKNEHNNLGDLMFRSKNDANHFMNLLYQIKEELGFEDHVSHQIHPGMICAYSTYAMGKPRSIGYLYFNEKQETDTLGNVEIYDVVRNEKKRYQGNVFHPDTFLIISKMDNMRWEAFSSYGGLLHGLEVIKRQFDDFKPFILNTNSHKSFNEILQLNKAYKIELIDGDLKHKGTLTLSKEQANIEIFSDEKPDKYIADLIMDAHHFIVKDEKHHKVWQVLEWDKKTLSGFIADTSSEDPMMTRFTIHL